MNQLYLLSDMEGALWINRGKQVVIDNPLYQNSAKELVREINEVVKGLFEGPLDKIYF